MPRIRVAARQIVLSLVLLTPFVALAGSYLGGGRLLGFHHYRQAHTAMTARNFAFHDANILHPSIDGVTYEKSLFPNEFPLYPYLVGMLWRQTGERLSVARGLSLLFGLLALCYYHRLLLRYLPDPWVAHVAVVATSFSPVMLYWSQAVQRQSLYLFAVLATMFHAQRALDGAGRAHAIAGLVALAVALLLNPFAVYLAIPLAWSIATRGEDRRGGVKLIAGLFLIASLPAAAWYAHAVLLAPGLEAGSKLAIHDPTNQRDFLSLLHYTLFFKVDNLLRFLQTVRDYAVSGSFSLGVLGFGFLVAWRRPEYHFFWVWLGSVMLYFVADPYPVSIQIHHYYFINLIPLTGLFFALGALSLKRAVLPAIAPEGVMPEQRSIRHGLRIGVPLLALVGAAQILYMGPATYRDMVKLAHHNHYYYIRDRVVADVEDGARIIQFSESGCPLLSYLLNDRQAEYGKLIRQRVVRRKDQSLEQVIAGDDFDYVLLTWHTPRFPVESSRAELAVAGFGTLVLEGPFFELYGENRPGVQPSPVTDSQSESPSNGT